MNQRILLSDEWKTQFTKAKPRVPAVLQIGIGIAIFVLGFIGEIHIGVPWWSGITFLTAGILLIVLVVKQLQILDRALLLSYTVDCVILALLAFELGLSIWILSSFVYANKKTRHASRQPKA
ncbi:uncharacterized protein LOC144827620 isoform X4 [Lissotriton helveticus]